MIYQLCFSKDLYFIKTDNEMGQQCNSGKNNYNSDESINASFANFIESSG